MHQRPDNRLQRKAFRYPTRKLHVLYAGSPTAGRSTSLASLSGVRPKDTSGYNPTHRLEGQEIRLSSGETILLDAMIPHTGNIFFESINAATKADIDWIRELALAIIAFLPKIDGVIFVADSSRHMHEDLNRRSLEHLLRDLSDAGLDTEHLPFVFQCNKRDAADAVPLAEMASSLSTARCAYVESVATEGYGVTRALDSLVALIDGGASGGVAALPEPALAHAEAAPNSLHRLFEETTIKLTSDGALQAVLRTSTQKPELVLTHGAIAQMGSTALTEVPDLAPGRYSIDIVERMVFLHKLGARRCISSGFLAARIRLPGTKVVNHEPLPLVERLGLTFVIASPRIIRAAAQLADGAYAQARAQGVSVVALETSRLDLAPGGDMAVFGIAARDVWLGRDGTGRVVQVSCYRGACPDVLLQMACDGRRDPG